MPLIHDVKVLWLREVRAALRERSILLNTIIIPVVLYPVLLWAMFTGIMFVRGQTQGFVSRVALTGLPAEHAGFRDGLAKDDKFKLVDPAPDPGTARQEIAHGTLDAFVEFSPVPNGPAGNYAAKLLFDESKDRSAEAHRRLAETLDRYRADWLESRTREHGVTKAAWQVFTVTGRNVASSRDMGQFLLGLMLPLFFTIMTAVGCFYPAVDSTAGERERGTWETTLATAASRPAIVLAKYLYVTSFGIVAAMLNVTAMLLSIQPILKPLLRNSGEVMKFEMPLAAVPVFLLGAVLLAAFIAAGMMLFAVFARTFKEGQAMITPFYMLTILPVTFLQVPGIEYTPGLAAIPIVGVTLMARSALKGAFPPLSIAATLLGSAAAIGLVMWLASIVMRFEDVLIGSYSGNALRFLKERLGRRSAPSEVSR